MDFTEKELKDLAISAFVLALAFAIMLEGGFYSLVSEEDTLAVLGERFVMSLIGVSMGFILHELGHRFLARRFDCFAEYEMWPAGLLLALAFSFFGFVLAAPGAVMIRPKLGSYMQLSRRKLGIISIAGPVMNMSLAIVFLIIYSLYANGGFWEDVCYIGALVNTWLAGFNLLPFGPFDGKKIFDWDRRVWAIALAVALTLLLSVLTMS